MKLNINLFIMRLKVAIFEDVTMETEENSDLLSENDYSKQIEILKLVNHFVVLSFVINIFDERVCTCKITLLTILIMIAFVLIYMLCKFFLRIVG
ncbi:hypothetical protein SOMG_02336 [Schizosaccharomyces osmophilus]|uniref:Uncharacterized protein n=1 Tax=Schizosaccharomyces osmophilus TaxID=2545709 RepID=A0AAE9W7N3_9SCHI|nr:uncharacterized protein SOMG_02336 [Schizosaccharomyces osmophilus]WBW71008.1 hypothetical protein SOMG_02336 [Schizosaccharomyces osmophilus]